MYIDLITRDNVQNLTAAQEFAKVREQDIKEKTDLFERLNTRLVELEKKDAANSAAAPGESIFEVRGLLKLSKGDIITVTNIGAATLTLAAPTPTNSYNVSTIIDRLS